MATPSSIAPGKAKTSGKLSRTLAYYASFIFLGFLIGSLGPSLPTLAENTGSGFREIGFLFTVRALGYLLGALLSGQLYDRFSGHRLIALVLIGIALLLFLIPQMNLLWLLAFFLLALGICDAVLDVGGNTLLIWAHGRSVGPYMNALHFFFGVGAFLAPVVIAQSILITGDITWGYWFLALLALPLIIAFIPLRSPPVDATTQKESNQSVNYTLVFLFALFFFAYVGAEVSFGGWIFTYVVNTGLLDEITAAYLNSVFWGAFTVGRLISIPIAFRLRPGLILLGDLLLSLVCVCLILIWQDSLAVVWIGAIGLGLAIASVFPTAISLAERHLTMTSWVNSWFFVGASLGAMIVPWLIGQLFESSGAITVMWVIVVDLLITIGIFALLMGYVARLGRDDTRRVSGG